MDPDLSSSPWPASTVRRTVRRVLHGSCCSLHIRVVKSLLRQSRRSPTVRDAEIQSAGIQPAASTCRRRGDDARPSGRRIQPRPAKARALSQQQDKVKKG